ncbi:MAG: tripartite tricarboxylate transporter substrate binding protein, partial [Rhodospirillales bacterium]|nr:tripartite tricarboxylate transporter substrate binding protein [Rhodospirillales bacterium]
LPEAGFGTLSVPGGSFKSIAVRKGTSKEVQGILADAFEKAFKSDLYQNFMTEKGVIPAFTKLSDTGRYFDELIGGFEPVIREAGLYRKK